MNMIEFKKITEENFKGIINMKQPKDQHYVASNAVSLAQAWLYYENHDVYPFAVYNEESLVGFMMLDEDLDERCMTVWRFMIAVEHQNKGYGTEALKKIISLVKESRKYDYMTLDYAIGNEHAKYIYEKLGFLPTGEISNGEVVMRLDF
jgi:diamine N-acetyltransferase